MPNRNHVSQCHYLTLMVALFFFLCSIYLLSYKVILTVNDELQMLDMVGSIVDFGDTKYDLSMWYEWDKRGPVGQDASALIDVRPLEPHDQGHIEAELPDRREDAVGDQVALDDSTKDVHEDGLHLGIA